MKSKQTNYSPDVWGKHAEILDGKIPEGHSVYGELVGWASPGKTIQSGYDYGIKQGESELWVYRVTKVDGAGNHYEFSWDEIKDFCATYDLKTVPEYYNGTAKDLFPEIPVDEKWGENFLAALKNKFLDKPCEFCSGKPVNEGVVLKINSKENKTALKFKSPKFVEKETGARDKGESNLEEES